MDKNDKLQEKLDLLSALKEDEENEKKKSKKKENKKKIDVEKAEEVLKEIKTVKSMTPKRKSRVLLTIASFLALVASLTYLIYTIVKATDQINQPYLIITSACLFIISCLLVLTGFIANRNVQKGMQAFVIMTIALYTGFQFLVTSNILTIPTLKIVEDFSNTSINEVIKWANTNHITLEQTYEYSDSVLENHIIHQDIPANTLLKDVKTLSVTVSNGPNYESIVNLPNMVGWNIDDVVTKIKDLKLNNVNITYEFSETVERDIAYEQSKSGEVRRNEEITIKFSLGKEADLSPVTLEDLINKEEFDATLWLKRNGIKYELTYEFSNEVESGNVISTDPSAGTLIEQKETTVKIVISKGPQIVAPDLMKMSLDEITEWAIKNKLILAYESEYNNEIKAGDIIRVSVKEGDVLEENQRIYIVTSKGTLKMISYTDGDITALRSFASENKITLNEESEFSETVEKGKFISVSKKVGEAISPTEEIKVVISLGASTEVPNFIGMNATNAQSTCKSKELECKFSYVYSSKTKGIIFNQSMTAGSKVIGGTSIVLTISSGPKPSNSGSNSGSSGGNSTNPKPPTETCTTYTLYLGAGSTVQQTKDIIKKQNPNGKFNFVTIPDPGYGTSGSLRRDMLEKYQGTTHTSCETITIYIIDKSA